MSTAAPDLWTLTWGQPFLDADVLASAVELQAAQGQDLDFRTRLLIRDSVRALEAEWGEKRRHEWVRNSPQRETICAILADDSLGPPGFPSLRKRVMTPLDPERVLQFFRALSVRVMRPTRLIVRGSIALILTGSLSRPTEDVDVVDEIPADLRTQHDLLRELSETFDLQLTHFQSHYLPAGWEQRIRSFDVFGQLQVFLVDTYDVYLSKLFSGRSKDLKDLRVLTPQLDKQRLTDRLLDTAAPLLGEPEMKKHARDNWYVLFGEPLPERRSA